MQTIDTKKIFDMYYEDVPENTVKKTRRQVDRDEVYLYEKKINKRLFDMDADDLIGYFVYCFNNENKTCNFSYLSIPKIASMYRNIWNFYIENIEIIKNPWNNKKMKGKELLKRISCSKKALTFEILQDKINNLYNEYPSNSYIPKYIECLLLLFYNGFSTANEIISLKKDMINFKTKEVKLRGRTLQLSDRCFELLEYVHGLDDVHSTKAKYKAVSYHGGYFKVIIRESSVDNFQDESIVKVASTINRKIKLSINNDFNLEINYRNIFLLGFFDYIVKKIGKEHAIEIITSVRNEKDIEELMRYAREYGINSCNISYIKKTLEPFCGN